MAPSADNLVAAARSLLILLDGEIELESAYQEWFESHEAAWRALGYERAYPHPRLEHPEGPRFPDFVAESSVSGLAEIVELKTPQLKLVRNPDKRPQFFAETTSAIVQLNEYQRILGDPRQREALEAQTGIHVSESPDLVLIGGSTNGLDPAILHELSVDQARRIRVLTYDDVLLRTASAAQDPMGTSTNSLSLYLAIRFPEGGTRGSGVVAALGDDGRCNSALVGLDADGNLWFQIKDIGGRTAEVKTATPLGIGEWHRIWCAIAVTGESLLMTITVNGVTAVRSEIRLPVVLRPAMGDQRYAIGADHRGANGARMHVYFHAVYGEYLDVLSRARLENFFETGAAENDGHRKYVDFAKEHWLAASRPGEDFRQPVIGRQPTFRDMNA